MACPAAHHKVVQWLEQHVEHVGGARTGHRVPQKQLGASSRPLSTPAAAPVSMDTVAGGFLVAAFGGLHVAAGSRQEDRLFGQPLAWEAKLAFLGGAGLAGAALLTRCLLPPEMSRKRLFGCGVRLYDGLTATSIWAGLCGPGLALVSCMTAPAASSASPSPWAGAAGLLLFVGSTAVCNLGALGAVLGHLTGRRAG